MGRRRQNAQIEQAKLEQIERGKRIKEIREEELHMNKAELGRILGISSQFLGLVEDGKGNLVYDSIRKLRDISGHSADYILYGLDDNIIIQTKEFLKYYSDKELIASIDMLKNIYLLIKNKHF